VAAALLPTATAPWGALGALALLLLFMVGIGFNLARGRRPDCHCFGQIHSAPVGWKTLARNGALAAVAGFLVWYGLGDDIGRSVVGWTATLSTIQLLGLVAVILVLGLLAGLLVHRLRQTGYFAVGAASPRDNVSALYRNTCGGTQQDMPPAKNIGEPAPKIELRARSGEIIDLWSIQGGETLVAFYDPDCPFCQQMLPELKKWEENRPEGAPELLVISTGAEWLDLEFPAMFDSNQAIFRGFGVSETPSAVLVDTEGKIASKAAIGAPAVLELAGAAGKEKRRRGTTQTQKGEFL